MAVDGTVGDIQRREAGEEGEAAGRNYRGGQSKRTSRRRVGEEGHKKGKGGRGERQHHTEHTPCCCLYMV